MKKRVVIILSITVALLASELGREYVAYRTASNKLERGYWQINGRAGISKEQVKQIVGEPDDVNKRAEENSEYWYWRAYQHQGWLLKRVGLASTKGHYILVVEFDNQERMVDVYGGIN